jgi:hypothetical protein
MTPWPPRASDPSNGRPSPPAAQQQRPPSATQTRWPPLDPSPRRSTYSTGGSATPVRTDGLRWFRFLSYLGPVEVWPR